MFFLVCAGAVVAWLLLESLLLSHWRRAVPLRIHVNGTRGKSTLTRKLTAALNAAGHVALGKTTGDAPELILPDGSVRPFPRRGPANIREQIKCLRLAARSGAKALVMECMGISPETVAVSEQAIIRSQLGIITDARLDHGETMGPEIGDVAATLALSTPEKGILITGEARCLPPLRAASENRGTRLEIIPPLRPGTLAGPEEDLRFVTAVLATLRHDATSTNPAPETSPRLHPCASPTPTNISSGVSLEYAATPAVPTIRLPPVRSLSLSTPSEFDVSFLDMFSVNDVESSDLLLSSLDDLHVQQMPVVFVLNTRSDRPLRTLQFIRWISQMEFRQALALTGDHRLAARAALALAERRIHSPRPVCCTGTQSLKPLLTELSRLVGTSRFFIVGLGNSHGGPVDALRQAAKPCQPDRFEEENRNTETRP